MTLAAVDLHIVHRARRIGDQPPGNLHVVPVRLVRLVVVLRDIDKGVELRMIEGPAVHGIAEIPMVPHFGDLDAHARPAGPVPHEPRPVAAPRLGGVALVADAVQHVPVRQRDGKQLIDECLLVGQHLWDVI
jgi:hypothetical protein